MTSEPTPKQPSAAPSGRSKARGRAAPGPRRRKRPRLRTAKLQRDAAAAAHAEAEAEAEAKTGPGPGAGAGAQGDAVERARERLEHLLSRRRELTDEQFDAEMLAIVYLVLDGEAGSPHELGRFVDLLNRAAADAFGRAIDRLLHRGGILNLLINPTIGRTADRFLQIARPRLAETLGLTLPDDALQLDLLLAELEAMVRDQRELQLSRAHAVRSPERVGEELKHAEALERRRAALARRLDALEKAARAAAAADAEAAAIPVDALGVRRWQRRRVRRRPRRTDCLRITPRRLEHAGVFDSGDPRRLGWSEGGDGHLAVVDFRCVRNGATTLVWARYPAAVPKKPAATAEIHLPLLVETDPAAAAGSTLTCPGCGARVAELLLPPGGPGYFLCGVCHRVAAAPPTSPETEDSL